MSGYVNYNIGMEPDVSGCWIDRWMDEKEKIVPWPGSLEGDFTPWRGILEGRL